VLDQQAFFCVARLPFQPDRDSSRSSAHRPVISALPHEVPRLAVTAQVTDMGPKRLEQMKAIEAKPQIIDGAPEIDGEKVDVRLPPAVPDRRFRRI